MKYREQKQSSPPAWLRWFVTDVSRGLVNRQGLAPVGCHIFHDSEADIWEVSVFVSRTEVVGGPQDGNVISTGLQLDVMTVCEAFDVAPEVHWQSQAVCEEDQLGNHMSFEGQARGHRVWLRVLHEAPEDIGPGRLLHAPQGVVEDLW